MYVCKVSDFLRDNCILSRVSCQLNVYFFILQPLFFIPAHM